MKTATGTKGLLAGLCERALASAARAWLARAEAEVAAGVDDARFAGLLSLASRHAGAGKLAPTRDEVAAAARILEGWNPERWSLLDLVRVALVLARPDLEAPSGARAVEEAFRYADVGELVALYRSLAHLPGPERFVTRAREGCRSNMRAVFEAAACDTPFPALHFDALAWRQLAIKCLFVGAPLWRVHGVDRRIDAELARMALDLADERRSAGREVQPELWMCLGTASGERGLDSIERELAGSSTLGRRGAAIALARAKRTERLSELALREKDPAVRATMRAALAGATDQKAFAELNPA